MIRPSTIALMLLACTGASTASAVDLGRGAVERGGALYAQYCTACHGLKYYRGKDAPTGLQPAMDPATAEAAFGVAPPDLSLMASARGRGSEGAEYIQRLLTTYYSRDGAYFNRAFAGQTHTDGAIAMPPPIPTDDPALGQKAADISAFLLRVSEPSLEDRRSLGPWVLSFMALLTAVLYLLNRATWKAVRKK